MFENFILTLKEYMKTPCYVFYPYMCVGTVNETDRIFISKLHFWSIHLDNNWGNIAPRRLRPRTSGVQGERNPLAQQTKLCLFICT